jgi:hypothetical protein
VLLPPLLAFLLLMKLLFNFKLMRMLGLVFHLVPNAQHLDGAWAKGYDLLKALYVFISHFKGDSAPTESQLEEMLAEAQAEQRPQPRCLLRLRPPARYQIRL